jgi:UDP-sulfoquinovose synthase
MARVIVLGGDGFCGWPTSLYLSQHGYDVVIVDNLSRRKIDVELEVQSLTPISPISNRLAAWEEVTGKRLQYENLTLGQDYQEFVELLKEVEPDAIVHFAEQRAAPYSMKSPREKRYTVRNNLNATHDVLCAIVESGVDAHLVHLGTMGVYGYGTAGMKVPEGYLPVTVNTEEGPKSIEILYPANPGSVYHMTKTQDQLFFFYYNKNNQLRITDLHQGIVWGTQTAETALDERLINRFDYDGDYGTVLNRFLMQAALSYPLTVHGTGGQTRAFIHIRDTVRCISLAIANPPQRGDRVSIFNQTTETHRLIDLAKMISEMSGTPYQLVDNPRNEAAENDLRVVNSRFIDLGLEPIRLQDGLLSEVQDIARKYIHRCDRAKIPCTSRWLTAADGGTPERSVTARQTFNPASDAGAAIKLRNLPRAATKRLDQRLADARPR